MEREKKHALVAKMKERLSDAELVIVTSPQGLSMSETMALRSAMREAGAGFMVTKNRLVKIALKDSAFSYLDDQFSGPTAIAYSKDPVAAAKAASAFAKQNEKFKLIGGGLSGQKLDADDVQALAKLPSLDALRSKLLGLMNAPATKLAGVLQAPAGQLARVTAAYGAKE